MSKNTKNRRTIYLPDELIEEIQKDIVSRAVKSGEPETLSAWIQMAARNQLGMAEEGS